jgi:hypothetical protein
MHDSSETVIDERFPIEHAANETLQEHRDRMVDAISTVGRVSPKEQAIQSLLAVAENCHMVAMAMQDSPQVQPFLRDPIPFMLMQVQIMRRFFPATNQQIDETIKTNLDRYYMSSEEADRSIAQYSEHKIQLDKLHGATVDGVQLYVLLFVNHEVPTGHQTRFTRGQMMAQLIDQPIPLSRIDWDPYYDAADHARAAAHKELLERPAANDSTGSEPSTAEPAFGDRPFVGNGAESGDIEIVSATFEPAPSEEKHPM